MSPHESRDSRLSRAYLHASLTEEVDTHDVPANGGHLELALSEIVERTRPFVHGARPVEAFPTVMTSV